MTSKNDKNAVHALGPAPVKKNKTINHREETEAVQARMLSLASGWTSARLAEEKVSKANTATNDGKSNQVDDDPVGQLFNSGDVIEPPFDLLTLSMLPEHSAELGQCVRAMEVGVESWGHRLLCRFDLDHKDATDELKSAAELERIKLVNFFEYASIDDSFRTLRRKARHDKETIGAMCFEVIRDAVGNVQGLEHVPAAQILLGKQSDEQQRVQVPILELQIDGSVRVVKIDRWKRHRLYLQSKRTRRAGISVSGARRAVWFKEFLDPRHIDNQTGKELKDPKAIEEARDKGKLANELIYMRYYTSRTAYGLPMYIGNLLAIFGDRAAEEINFMTFRNNNIPSMAVMVSNGQLTDGTIKRIESFVESQIQGSDNWSKFLIIEAESFIEGEDGGHMKVDIKPLTAHQHKDAMFQEYSANNRDAIRRAFRLPPIIVGRSDDYTRSTAETSRKLADEQVFAPERDVFDEFVNRKLFPEMGICYWKYKSNSPNTTDNTELVKILSDGEKTGGMTPRIARAFLEDILGKELPPFPEDFPADVPFSLTMAEAVKNLADPKEPGQQVTALKALEAYFKSTSSSESEEAVGAAANEAVSRILKLRKLVESSWEKAAERAMGDVE